MLSRQQLASRRGSITALSELVSPQYAYMRWWFQDVLSKHLAQVVQFARFKGKRGGIPRLLLSMPRRCCKTEYASVLTPASFLGQWPGGRVMTTGYNRDLVAEMVERTREHMTSDGYTSTFQTRIGKVVDAVTDKTIAAKNATFHMKTLIQDGDGRVQSAGGGYFAVGVKGGATGHGFDLGIIDDWIRDREQAYSVAEKRRRVNFYDAAFESGQEGVSAMLAIATTWQRHGLLKWIYDRWKDQGYEPIWLRFPALFDPETASEYDQRTEVDEPLWPVKFPRDHLEKIRKGLLNSNPDVWWSLYQQAGRGEGGVIFKPEHWRWFDSTFDLGNLHEIHISVDPNQKATGRSFGTAGVYGVIDSWSDNQASDFGVNYFRIDEARGHWDYTVMRAEVKRLMLKWKRELPRQWEHPKSGVWIEDKAGGHALIPDLRETYPELAHKIHMVPKIQSKESCYRTACVVPKAQRVWLPQTEYSEDGTPREWDGPVTSSWANVREKGGFVDELEAQQPVHEPNDRPDEFAQMIICREPNLGPDMLRL